MSTLLFSIKPHFKHVIIYKHPTTLRYCKMVYGKEYRKYISYFNNLDLDKYKNAVIISDSPNKNCDIWIDLDYYNDEKRKKYKKIPYYVSPGKRYYNYKSADKNNIKSKVCRIFFAGAIPNDGYPILKQTFPEMLNRTEIVDFIMEMFPNNIHKWDDLDSVYNDILLAVKDARLGQVDYCLDFNQFELQLQDSDFFIAPPGNGMPHCHNCMEALKNGAIPITNYAEWFEPKLENGVNCLIFNTKEELTECINIALKMSADDVKK